MIVPDTSLAFQTEARLFKALMHPARLEILNELRRGEACVCHLEAHLGCRQSFISQHLTVLKDAGLVTDRRDGWNVYYTLADARLTALIDDASRLCAVLAGGEPALNPAALRPVAEPDCPCPRCAVETAAIALEIAK